MNIHELARVREKKLNNEVKLFNFSNYMYNLMCSNIAQRSALPELEKNLIREESFYSHNEIKLKVKRSREK